MNKIGWFKKGLILGEDSYAAAKLLLATYQVAYVADACCYHSHNYTILQEFKRYFDIGVFHSLEHNLLKQFGSPLGEGKRYLKSEFAYILKQHKLLLLPEFFARNGMKFLGFKLGLNYRLFSLSLNKRMSMHRAWWNR